MVFRKCVLISTVITLMFMGGAVFAEDLEQVCAPVADPNFACSGMSTSQCRQFLEKCAAYYEQESEKIAQDLTKTAQEKKTLQGQVSALQKKITNLNYQIKQGNLVISDLKIQIGETKSSIDKTSLQIEQAKDQIADILKTISEEDDKSIAEILLEGNLSNFFSNVAHLEGLNARLKDLLLNTKDLKTYLESQKNKMDNEKAATERTVKVQSLQKQANEDNKKQQEGLLKLTEAQYQQQLTQKQDAEKKAAAIKARIFELIGVSKAPTFGEAYDIAKYVSSLTGVRPAFLLAVLTQESNIGKNVGQCYVTNLTTGTGTSLSGDARTRVISPKSIQGFINLVTSLGMEPTKTPVSCWIPMYTRGVAYGFGGAMGPAQFIASTWNLYDDKVSAITGKTANPWNIKDAFLAAGLLLRDNGAAKSEFTAAMIYFSGGSWTKSEEFYGRSVLAIAAGYADDIAALGN